jgi:5-methylcytosine-specific restriction endonuclease McrA
MVINCLVCGTEVEASTRGRARKFCSKECSRLSRRKLPSETLCWFCRAELPKKETAGFPQRYCDRVCASKFRVEQKKQTRDLSGVCVNCNVVFIGKKQNLRYCSASCRAEGNLQKSLTRREVERKNKPDFKEQDCGWCGLIILVPYRRGMVNKYHDHCAIQARRAYNRIKSVRRQGAKTDKWITHEEIALRDNHICHICGDQVDMSLPRTSKLGATLDHVIPISKGGLDSLDNLKLAHWICNIRKSDRIGVTFVASEAE